MLFLLIMSGVVGLGCSSSNPSPPKVAEGAFKVDPNERPLLKAVFLRDLDKARRLIREGVSPNELGLDGHPPLYFASISGQKEMAELLISSGAEVNRTTRKKTALLGAVILNKPETLAVLIKHGADPEQFLFPGGKPVNMAVRAGSVEALKVLLEHGATPNIKDPNGNTPLHIAAMKKDARSVHLLLKHGARVNTRGDYGNTALNIAVFHSDDVSVRLLLSYKANAKLTDSNGRRPLDLVDENSTLAADTRELLRKAS